MSRALYGAVLVGEGAEIHLYNCIKSLSVCDYVVLGCTTDESYEFLNKHHPPENVSYHRIEGENFHEWRNFLLSLIPEEAWVLMLDLDERLVINDKKLFFDKLNNGPIGDANVAAYVVDIVNPHVQAEGFHVVIWSEFTRLFINKSEFRYIRTIHESISESILEAGYEAKYLTKGAAYIAHLGYDISWDEMAKKIERNMALMWDAVKEHPEESVVWMHLGKTYAMIRKLDTAMECYNMALKGNGNKGLMGQVAKSMMILKNSGLLKKNYDLKF